MTKTNKILSGLLAFLPLVLWVIYMVFVIQIMMDTILNIEKMSEPQEASKLLMASFARMFGFMLVLGLVSLAKLIYFLIHITNNKKLDSNERLVWILVGVFVGTFGFPVYWYLKIWKEEKEGLNN